MNPGITALADKPGEQVGISAERLDTLEADVIVFATEKPSDVGRARQDADVRQARRGRGATARSTPTGRSRARLYFTSPLSLDYALDRLAPQLQDAIDGKAPRKVVDTTTAPPAED